MAGVLNEGQSERVELPGASTAVRLLLLTGCRLNEIVKIRWEHVCLDETVLRLPDSRTGAKVVQLGQAAVEVLAGVERTPFHPHVIPGTLPGQSLSDLQPFWCRLRARAGLKDVPIHDMRHTYAAVAVASARG